MKFMVIVKASPESEAGQMPSQELLTQMGRFNEELAKAGVMLAGEGLYASAHGARVRFAPQAASPGWNAPALAPWLEASLARASESAFRAPPAYMGEGGSIPFMAMLGEKFPAAQFVVTGVLGPHSNAHGPNEFLHLPTGRRIMEAATTHLTPISLELGGKAPFIVMPDADLDLAVRSAITSRYMNCGQVCICNERTLVHEAV